MLRTSSPQIVHILPRPAPLCDPLTSICLPFRLPNGTSRSAADGTYATYVSTSNSSLPPPRPRYPDSDLSPLFASQTVLPDSRHDKFRLRTPVRSRRQKISSEILPWVYSGVLWAAVFETAKTIGVTLILILSSSKGEGVWADTGVVTDVAGDGTSTCDRSSALVSGAWSAQSPLPPPPLLPWPTIGACKIAVCSFAASALKRMPRRPR